MIKRNIIFVFMSFISQIMLLLFWMLDLFKTYTIFSFKLNLPYETNYQQSEWEKITSCHNLSHHPVNKN